MKPKERLNQLKKQFDRLRKDSMAAVGTANEAVYSGLQQFAEKELKALHEYYDGALTALKAQKKEKADVRTVLLTQFDLMQGTFNQLIANARESLDALSKSAPAAVPPAASKPARKAPKKAVKKAAKKATKKAAKKAAPPAPSAE